MQTTQKLKEKQQPQTLTSMLNQLLADSIDLRMKAKQAHWNVRGENFIALHELFDRVSREVDEFSDMLAERIAQLGVTARGDLQAVACQSSLMIYPDDLQTSDDHLQALGVALSMTTDSCRGAINRAMDANDLVTADLLTEITRGLDKLNWYIRSHIS